jgi:hypothetical protein
MGGFLRQETILGRPCLPKKKFPGKDDGRNCIFSGHFLPCELLVSHPREQAERDPAGVEVPSRGVIRRTKRERIEQGSRKATPWENLPDTRIGKIRQCNYDGGLHRGGFEPNEETSERDSSRVHGDRRGSFMKFRPLGDKARRCNSGE